VGVLDVRNESKGLTSDRDYALLNTSLSGAITGTYNMSKSADYPTTIEYGTAFWSSYGTFSDTRYIHGLNLGKSGQNSGYRSNLLQAVASGCKRLEDSGILFWELGNEPDLYKTSAQGPVREATYDEAAYVKEWIDLAQAVEAQVSTACPGLTRKGRFKMIAPSFAGVSNSLDPAKTWNTTVSIGDGQPLEKMTDTGFIAEFSSHK
jgi:hypothetical protein